MLSTVVGPPLACTPCITEQVLAVNLALTGRIKVQQSQGLPYLHTARLEVDQSCFGPTPKGGEVLGLLCASCTCCALLRASYASLWSSNTTSKARIRNFSTNRSLVNANVLCSSAATRQLCCKIGRRCVSFNFQHHSNIGSDFCEQVLTACSPCRGPCRRGT